MQRRDCVLLTLAALTAGCAATGTVSGLAPDTTLIVIRHAERTGEDLTKRGRAQARALVGALDGMPLDAIYSPGIQRNLDTAAPLAAARGMTVERRPAENPAPRLVRESAGRTVLWVGNKGNIAAIWEALALPDPAPLDYGDLFIVRSDAAGVMTVTRQSYGL
ncbi:histidine phosphatase family protein [Thalassococcus sp. BH17M4-6]|uniref:histidine phosphatase family protein n=1 Tax=Thalassococcus sp. BH17M4-6 TaxID=3413148 RepID=UPI003BE57A15